eukprot:8135505-Pyramimonas_sp.AAC.1
MGTSTETSGRGVCRPTLPAPSTTLRDPTGSSTEGPGGDGEVHRRPHRPRPHASPHPAQRF